ncbi:hypothetical protein W822_22870 [Advenella kashmirensis W13003]|uniref:Uncharacterized protein n=1 Tax=Advenella kashmirensis W13003 TaxID=1424334 RepID=V8QK46_9BURK|nr:hypothetical protein W822_22870 [Advenella kashmirensis W13003]
MHTPGQLPHFGLQTVQVNKKPIADTMQSAFCFASISLMELSPGPVMPEKKTLFFLSHSSIMLASIVRMWRSS